MQFYFGRIDDSDDIVDDYFVSKDSLGTETHFLYGIEFGSGPTGFDGITIYDSCKRSVPIDIDSIPELILALQDLLDFQEQVEDSFSFIKQVKDKSFVYTQEKTE